MARKTRKELTSVIKVRSRKPGKVFGTRFVEGHSDVNSNGRILTYTRVSLEQVNRVGEYNDIPKKLMKEFREVRNNGTKEYEPSYSRV